jgi:hypothetical protein
VKHIVSWLQNALRSTANDNAISGYVRTVDHLPREIRHHVFVEAFLLLQRHTCRQRRAPHRLSIHATEPSVHVLVKSADYPCIYMSCARNLINQSAIQQLPT